MAASPRRDFTLCIDTRESAHFFGCLSAFYLQRWRPNWACVPRMRVSAPTTSSKGDCVP